MFLCLFQISHILWDVYIGTDDGSAYCNQHPHSPTISFWFRLNRLILRLCSTHQFKNLQVSDFSQSHHPRPLIAPCLCRVVYPPHPRSISLRVYARYKEHSTPTLTIYFCAIPIPFQIQYSTLWILYRRTAAHLHYRIEMKIFLIKNVSKMLASSMELVMDLWWSGDN